MRGKFFGLSQFVLLIQGLLVGFREFDESGFCTYCSWLSEVLVPASTESTYGELQEESKVEMNLIAGLHPKLPRTWQTVLSRGKAGEDKRDGKKWLF